MRTENKKEILMKQNVNIYLDHAATTRPFPEVLEAMLPYYDSGFGNPSSVYELGEESKRAVERAREQIAATLNVTPDTIYFTSGGTESDNWALRYAAGKGTEGSCAKTGGAGRKFREESFGRQGRLPHIITTSIEHPAVLRTCEELEQEGVRVTYLPVGRDGIVSLSALEQAICPDTVLISVMYANNEIGTIQPVEQAARIAKRRGILFHSDAVQAYGQIPIDPRRLGIDMMSASGHKLNGPKGIGFLYVGKGIDLKPMIRGGSQERRMRAGTENVPGIVGFGTAARMSHQLLQKKRIRESALRDYFFRRLLTEIRDIRINGSVQKRLPNNVNVSIRGVNGSALVALLDLEGICISAASACTAGSDEPSHVQLAIGNSPADALSAIRITPGMENTREEADRAIDAIRRLTEELRTSA